MSSRHKASKNGRGFPTRWSSWEWNDDYKCDTRYRKGESGQYEYEYGTVQPDYDQRTVPTMGTIPQPYPQTQYTYSVGYTTAPDANVDSVTQGISQATLSSGSSPEFSQPYAQSTPNANHITAGNQYTVSETIDPRYKVHSHWEFKLFRVFQVLWTEPIGNDGYGSDSENSFRTTFSERTDKYGHVVKFRRFVIIESMEGHCICLPIMTYGGEGVNKRGVDAKYHTIIYSSETAVDFKGEKGKGLMRKSIRVLPLNSRYKLDPASRLNYAKPYTIEYNMKVLFIGEVHPKFQRHLVADYNLYHPNFKSREVLPHTQSTTGAVDHAQGGGNLAESYLSGLYDSGSSYSNANPYTSTPSYTTATSYPTMTQYNIPSSKYETYQEPHGIDRSGAVVASYPSSYPSIRTLDMAIENMPGVVKEGKISSRDGNRYREGHRYGDREAHGEITDEPHDGEYDEPESQEGPEVPIWPSGDPLHDPDPDDNGDQGDQDKGGGQRTFQRYSRRSELRR